MDGPLLVKLDNCGKKCEEKCSMTLGKCEGGLFGTKLAVPDFRLLRPVPSNNGKLCVEEPILEQTHLKGSNRPINGFYQTEYFLSWSGQICNCSIPLALSSTGLFWYSISASWQHSRPFSISQLCIMPFLLTYKTVKGLGSALMLLWHCVLCGDLIW